MGPNGSTGNGSSDSSGTGSTDLEMIPAMLTNSFNAIVEHFGSSITELTAHGSVVNTNKSEIEDLREYGVTLEQQNRHRLKLDYQQIVEDGEPWNPIDADAIGELQHTVQQELGGSTRTVKGDLAVRSLTIRETDERLAEITPAQTDEFTLEFRADPAEDAVRSLTQARNEDRRLYDELGFNCHNLNLRSVVETATEYHEQYDGRYFHWEGPDHVRVRIDDILATRISRHILPDRYGILKPYGIVNNEILDIDEDHVDEAQLRNRMLSDDNEADEEDATAGDA